MQPLGQPEGREVPARKPLRALRVDARLQLPLVALQLHARLESHSLSSQADLLLLHAAGVELRCSCGGRAGEGGEFHICAAELALRDVRPGVPADRSPLLLLEGASPKPLPLGIEASLEVRGAVNAGFGASRQRPLLCGFFVPLEGGVVGWQLTVGARRLVVQWNHALARQLISLSMRLAWTLSSGGVEGEGGEARRGEDEEHGEGGEGGKQKVARSRDGGEEDEGAEERIGRDGGGSKLRLKMNGSVDEISLSLNLDDPIAIRQGDLSSAPPTEEEVEEALRKASTEVAGYTPLPREGVEVLVHIRASCRGINLQLDEVSCFYGGRGGEWTSGCRVGEWTGGADGGEREGGEGVEREERTGGTEEESGAKLMGVEESGERRGLAICQDRVRSLGQLQLRLEAAFYELVSPIHSPPAASTFQMARPWTAMCANPGEAGVSVRVVKDESTLGLLEVLVESEPLVYEYRNQ
ncbi:MAG: hypothetical protein SGPRY_014547, partial [Prymnesium sp.]